MNKTKIEWCDYTWNPVKGLCPVGCDYCYARRIYKRFKLNPEIRLDEKELNAPIKLRKPSRIFAGSTIELFGDWVDSRAMLEILMRAASLPWHTFIFLTKRPDRMIGWKFPANCWTGITAENPSKYNERINNLRKVHSKLKFISFEPLMFNQTENVSLEGIDWIIIGAMTPKPCHSEGAVKNLIRTARKYAIPVFLKDNLKWPEKIQEFPPPTGRDDEIS